MRSDTRERLLDAAQEAFAAHGYSGTSIRQLASAVSIKESSVYNHFPGKRAIFEAILERARRRIRQEGGRLGSPVDHTGAASARYIGISADALEAIARGFLRLWLEDPQLQAARRILALEQYRSREAGELLRSLLIEEPLEFQKEIFEVLITAGDLAPADPGTVARAFWGPVLVILHEAEAPAADPEHAEMLLRMHIEHFRRTHLRRPEPTEESS